MARTESASRNGDLGAQHGAQVAGAERSTVQSVERSLDLLELLVNAAGDMGVRELSEATELPVGTVHRLLAVLQARGYVRQDPASRRYTVGFSAMDLASKIASRGGLRLRAQPLLRRLADDLGETALLAVYDDRAAVVIASESPARAVRFLAEGGSRLPLHATAAGKVVLTYITTEKREALVRQLELVPHTPATVVDPDRVLGGWRAIRTQGYALDDGEYEEGVRSIASPVRDFTTHPIAAIGIAGPTSRLPDERLPHTIESVKAAAAALSEALGYERPAVQNAT
jgi:DNA-binding IclR family transcriptional regulator